jgi:hypothetical protein
MKILKLILLFILVNHTILAQDSIVENQHSVRRASMLSTLLPGSGQLYNHIHSTNKSYSVFWKLPVIYSSLAASSYLFIQAVQLEKELKQEYFNRDQNLTSPKWSNYDQYNILTLHTSAKKKRDLYGILLLGLYVLQIADASVEAHFMHFDISPTITLNIQPTISNSLTGLNLCFNFR